MGTKPINFDKARKRRQRTVTLKRLLALTGVMLLVSGAAALNGFLVEEGFTTKLSDIKESMGGTGYPAELPGGIIHGVGNIGENLVVLNDTNLYIYNSKAKMIRNIQKMTEQSVAVTSDSRVLAYTPGGKAFAVHSLSRELYSASTEFGVICGSMNTRGDFAIAAPVKQFASKVYVYNRKFEEIYNWSSPEYVTDISISPKGDMMALNCVSGDGGVLESLIYIFRFSEDRQKAEVAMRLTDSLCLDIDFAGDERIMVLTDRQYMCLNSLGEIKYSYDFGGRQVLGFETGDKQTLLLMGGQDKKDIALVLLDDNLKEKAARTLKTGVLDIKLSRDTVYILSGGGIEACGFDLEPKSRFEERNISKIYLVGNRLYYLTPNEIRVLEQSDMASVSKKKTG